jgi:hypothetical protein
VHFKYKPIQRVGLQLMDGLLRHSPEDHAKLDFKVFKCVLDALSRNDDDTTICYFSFSILSQLATEVLMSV